jgi:hypothetical protein
MTKLYLVELNGEYGEFDTVADIQAWARGLIGRFYWLKGKSLNVSKRTPVGAYLLVRTIVVGA